MLYILLVVSSFLLLKSSTKKDKHRSNKQFFIICFLWIFVVGIRHHVGIDTINYETKYENTEGLNVIQIMFFAGYEFMWSLFMYVLHLFNLPFVYLQFVHAILFNILLFIFIKNVSTNPSVSLILFFIFLFFYFETEILRESLAVIVSLIALFLLYKKEKTIIAYMIYYMLVILAILFHSSAIIMLGVPFVLKWFESKCILPKLLFIMVFILLFSTTIVNQFIDMFVTNAVVDKIEGYQERVIGGNLLYLRIIEAFISIVVAWYYLKSKNEGKYYKMISAGVWLYAIFMIGACVMYGVFGRLINYFSIIYYIAIGELIVNKVVHIRFIGRMYCFAMLILFSYQMVSPAINGLRYYNKYLPYTTQFDDDEFEERKFFQNLQQY